MPPTTELLGRRGMCLILVAKAPGRRRSRLIPAENVPSIGVLGVFTDSMFTVQGYLSFLSVHRFRFDVNPQSVNGFSVPLHKPLGTIAGWSKKIFKWLYKRRRCIVKEGVGIPLKLFEFSDPPILLNFVDFTGSGGSLLTNGPAARFGKL